MTEKSSLITIADVDYVAKLAHLTFDEQEKEDIVIKLGSILDYMQQLGDIDTQGVEPTTHVLPLANVFRDDIVGPQLDREQALKIAPERDGNYYKVPRIL